jgi:hypothetical protein
MEPLFCVRQLVEKFKEKKKLCMVVTDLENMNDKVLREILKWALIKKKVPKIYIQIDSGYI